MNPSSTSDSCREYFDHRCEFGDTFWSALDARHPECVCEGVAVSEYSPCPVASSETLVSVVTNETYVAKTGKLEPTFFDKRISNGISTERKRFTSKSDYDLRATKLVEGKANKANCGSIELSVGGIRAIQHNGKRAFGVYDTAQEENIAHAEIASTNVPPPGTKERKRIRAKLRSSLLKVVLHDCRILDSSEIFGITN